MDCAGDPHEISGAMMPAFPLIYLFSLDVFAAELLCIAHFNKNEQ